MSCERCGAPTHDRLCTQCQLADRHDTTDRSTPDTSTWECVECGHVYESREWIDCPACGSDRRRAAPEVCPA